MQDMKQYICCRAQEHFCAIEVLNVREVVIPEAMTPVPLTTAEVCGLFNLRGRILPVIDLAILLGEEIKNRTMTSRMLVVRSNSELESIRVREERWDLAATSEPIALMIDELISIAPVDENSINSAPGNTCPEILEIIRGVSTIDGLLYGIVEMSALANKIEVYSHQ